MGCCHPSGLPVGLHLGLNNLHCWPVLEGHDWEVIVPFYRAHCAKGPRWLVPGQAENPKARGGIAPAPSLSIPQSSLHPHKPLKLLSQPSSSRRRYLGMLIPLHHGSPAHLVPRAAQTVAPSATPNNQPHLCRERQKGKGTSQGAVGRKRPLCP